MTTAVRDNQLFIEPAMPTMCACSQNISAGVRPDSLAELSRFHFVVGDKTTLVHIFNGVWIASESDDQEAENADLLHPTFGGAHATPVAASYGLDLMQASDPASEGQLLSPEASFSGRLRISVQLSTKIPATNLAQENGNLQGLRFL